MEIKLPKPNKYGTVVRSAVARLIERGVIEAKCNYHYTDDYAWDNANKFGQHDWLPTHMQKDSKDRKEGFVNFDKYDFKSSSGSARIHEDGTLRFCIHSNLSYTLRVKEIKNGRTTVLRKQVENSRGA